jgi:hypothetical protein
MLASLKLTYSTCWYALNAVLVVLVAAMISVPGTAGAAMDTPEPRFVAGDVDTFPRVEYTDGLVSVNDRYGFRIDYASAPWWSDQTAEEALNFLGAYFRVVL